jgi:hypothetical protein
VTDAPDAPAYEDNREALLREVEHLRVGPDDRLVIRIDPSVELEAAGFHEALQQVLADAGLAGRVVVISLPVTKVEFAKFDGEQGLRDRILEA